MRTCGRCIQKSNKDLLKSFWANWSKQIPKEIFLLPKWTGWSIYCCFVEIYGCLLRSDGIFFFSKTSSARFRDSGQTWDDVWRLVAVVNSTACTLSFQSHRKQIKLRISWNYPRSLSLSLLQVERAQPFKAPAELWVSSLNVSEPAKFSLSRFQTRSFY